MSDQVWGEFCRGKENDLLKMLEIIICKLILFSERFDQNSEPIIF